MVGQDMSGNKKPSTLPSGYSPRGSGRFGGVAWLRSDANSAFELGGADFTIEAWIYPTANGPTGGGVIFSKGNLTSVGAEAYTFQLSTTATITWYTGAANGLATPLVTSTAVTLNKWSHVALTRSGSTHTIWIDGVSAGTGTSSYTVTTGGPAWVGMGWYAQVADRSFTGNITNLRVTKGTAVYTKNFTPSTTFLTADFGTSLLLLCSSSAALNVDSSFNNITLTNSSIPWSDNTPFYTPKGSIAFQSPGSQSLDLPTSSAAAFGTGDFTVEAWVYINANHSGTFCIFSVGASTAGSYGLYWQSSLQKFDAIRYGDTAGSGRTTNTYATGQWLHVANSRVSGTSRVFINGVLDAGATYAMGSVTATTALSVGGGWAVGPNNGFVSGLRVVLGTGLYTTNFLPPTAPPTAITNTTILLNSSTPATLLKDSSTNNYTVTNTGGVAQSSFVPYVTQPIPTGSVGFTSTGANYYTVTAPALPGDFTLEAWVYLSTSATPSSVIMGNSVLNWDWWVYNSGVVVFYAGGGVLNTTTTLPFNSWAHVATVRIGTTVKTYINGIADPGSGTTSTSFVGGSMYIGRDEGVNGYFNGRVTNLRITVGTGLYTSNFLPSLTPLPALASTSFLLTTPTDATSAVDFSTSKRVLTKVGTPTWTNASPFPVQY